MRKFSRVCVESGLRRPALVHITTVPMTVDAFLVEQLNAASSSGYDVHVITAHGPEVERIKRRLIATVHIVDMDRGFSPLRDLGSLCSLVRVLKAIGPDVVHAHTPKAGLLGMIAAAVLRVRLRVYTVHGVAAADTAGALGRLLQASDLIACGLAHRILAVSPSLRAELERRRVAPEGEITVLRAGSVDGVDAQLRFNPARLELARAEVRAAHGLPADAFVIGYAGRLAGDKGLEDLARAWRLVRQQLPGARLLLVGSQDSRDPITDDLLHEWNDDPRVVLSPFRTDIERYYAAMDCLALPSYREGLGMVVLEAAAMEIPAVVNRVCGCIDAVADGVTGTVVDTRDSSAFASALVDYAASPYLARSHGAAGRRRVLDRFRPDTVRHSLFQLYANALPENAHTVTRVSVRVVES